MTTRFGRRPGRPSRSDAAPPSAARSRRPMPAWPRYRTSSAAGARPLRSNAPPFPRMRPYRSCGRLSAAPRARCRPSLRLAAPSAILPNGGADRSPAEPQLTGPAEPQADGSEDARAGATERPHSLPAANKPEFPQISPCRSALCGGVFKPRWRRISQASSPASQRAAVVVPYNSWQAVLGDCVTRSRPPACKSAWS